MPGWRNESISDNKHVYEVSSYSMKGNRNEKQLCKSPVFGDVRTDGRTDGRTDVRTSLTLYAPGTIRCGGINMDDGKHPWAV